MPIPPISSGPPQFHRPSQDYVQQFYAMWTEWVNETDPGKAMKEGKKLLEFLEKPAVRAEFERMAQMCPPPRTPHVPFAHAYDTAVGYLSRWIGAHNANTVSDNRTPTSEYLNDIYQWIRQ